MTKLDIFEKSVWILWLQGWQSAPDVAQACLQSWRRRNPGWNVRALDRTSLADALPQHDLDWMFAAEKEPEALSDQVRISLLQRHGGVWADATTMCATPLDEWLPSYLDSGFFAFDRPGPDRMLASWFLASDKGGYIVSSWHAATVRYWTDRQQRDNYFWFHRLFAAQYEADAEFRRIWDETRKISARHTCHFGPDDSRLYSEPTPDYELALRAPPAPVFKLTHKLPGVRAERSLITRLIAYGHHG